MLVSGALAGSWSPAAAATKDPCKLLKATEIETVLGTDVAEGRKGRTTAVIRNCEWDLPAAAGGAGGLISATIQTSGAKLAFDTNRQQAGVEDLAELGKAYYIPAALGPGSGGSVWMLKGSKLLSINDVLTPVADKAQLEELARLARKRL